MQQGCCYKALTRCAVALFGLYFGVAQAATITVDDATDGSTANCTLRDAVAAANNDTTTGGCSAGSDADTINFAAGLNGQTIPVATSGHIEITSDITIDGLDGSGVPLGIILDAADPDTGVSANRIFYVSGGDTLTVKGLTFQNGDVSGLVDPNYNGGAIWVEAANHSLTVEDCRFADNKAASGGAITVYKNNAPSDSGTLNVFNSIFSENTATYDGGAIYAENAVTVSSSAFSGNTATRDGGVILAGTATVLSSTFSGNTAARHGGAIYTVDDATVSSSTFSGNTATKDGGAISVDTATVSSSVFVGNTATESAGRGGAIYAYQGLDARHLTLVNNNANNGASIYMRGLRSSSNNTLALHNSIIVGAQSNAHCAVETGRKPFIIGTYNLEWTSDGGGADGASCSDPTTPQSVSAASITSITDIVSTTLADNGGATKTLALPTGSPAHGAADKTVNGTSKMWDLATSAWIDATLDQRGSARKAVGTGRDLGAYEANALSLNGSPLDATVGDTYNETSIAVIGGTGTYAYTVTRGSLPLGLSLDSTTGVISGTPAQAGNYDFSVTVTDNGTGELTGKEFIIAVAPRALGSVPVPVLPLPLLLILAGLLVGIAGRARRFNLH